jgi:hypothetical protein
MNPPSLPRWHQARRIRALLAPVACLLTAGCIAGCIAGCGSSPPGDSARPAPPLTSPLATSFGSTAGSGWAIVEMGGSASQEENFWQLFGRPTAQTPWQQVTPLGVADNGGLVVASPGGTSLFTGFRPSQDLTYSPLAASSDSGASWSPTGPVTPGLASVPDALAASPGGPLVALTAGGGVQLGSGSGATWKRLSSTAALAATPAGRACGLTGLTAVAFASSGTAMLAGGCSRPGTAGIFADSEVGRTGSSWHAAGPSLSGSMAREDIDVLRLAATGTGIVALLRVGTGDQASLVAAFWQPASAGSPGSWTRSAPLRIGTGQLLSTTVGPGWAIGVTLNGSRGATLAGPGSAWQTLPALPRWTATLALGQPGMVDAIGAHLSKFTNWQLVSGSRWSLVQTINVNIPYGSSS